MKFRFIAMAVLLAALGGCGDDDPVVNSGGLPRVVDVAGGDASCDEGETLVSAYCFADPGRSISASGPAIQADADGRLTVTCLTGGNNLRLFCQKQ